MKGRLIMSKLLKQILIYIKQRNMEGRLFTNKQNNLSYGRRLLVNNNLLLVGGAY